MNIESRETQGIIVTGYGHLLYSVYMFLRIGPVSRTKMWLAEIARETTSAHWETTVAGAVKKPEFALNIAFTCAGIRSLGFPEASLATFSEEFQQGMAEPSRSRRLGDVGSNSPDHWEIGGTQSGSDGEPVPAEIHILLILQGKTEEELATFCTGHRNRFISYGLEEAVPAQEGHLSSDNREHFGFRDSISQPEIEGSPKKAKPAQSLIQKGEFILGYPNSYGSLPPTPTVPQEADSFDNLRESAHNRQERDFGRNGSYLVFRKLHQDVAGFRKYFRDKFDDPQICKRMQAKFVGRWQNGTPLTLSPESDDPAYADPPQNNAFLYMEKDQEGYGCPIGAHIRRTNPRDAMRGDPVQSLISVDRHRLLRRGVSYGDPLPPECYEEDGQPRGLLFFCINADIKRQFEFVQQTWVNNPKFHGLYDDPDPLIGNNLDSYAPDDSNSLQMTIQDRPVRKRLMDVPQFVTVRGGGYFFLPSISALYFLAGVKQVIVPESDINP